MRDNLLSVVLILLLIILVALFFTDGRTLSRTLRDAGRYVSRTLNF